MNKPAHHRQLKATKPLRSPDGFCASLRCAFRLLRLKAVNAPGGINNFIAAGVERVAVAANLNANLLSGGAYGKNRPARAGCFGIGIKFWVDVFLHTANVNANLRIGTNLLIPINNTTNRALISRY